MIWFWHLSRMLQSRWSNDYNCPSWADCLLLSIAEKKHDICKIVLDKRAMRAMNINGLRTKNKLWSRNDSLKMLCPHTQCKCQAILWPFSFWMRMKTYWLHKRYWIILFVLQCKVHVQTCYAHMNSALHAWNVARDAFSTCFLSFYSISVLKICSLFDWMRRNHTSGVASAVSIFNWNIEIEIVVFEINHNYIDAVHSTLLW